MIKNLLADISVGPIEGFGPLGLEGAGTDTAPSVFSNFLSTIIGLLTIIAAIWFVVLFITGAIGIIISGGDKNALEDARKKITTGIIGIVVVIAAVFIIDLIGSLIGLDILNITGLFQQIAP
jgi:hypothetical protein